MILHIMPEIRMHPPVSLFLRITPPSKNIRTSFAPKVILHRCKQTGWDIYIYIYIYIPWFYLVLPMTSHHSRRSQKRKKQSKLSKQLVRKKISLKVKNNLESWVQACLSRLPLVYGAVKHFGIVWICVTSQSADFSCMRLPRTPLCLFA